ncbi:3073_t:CDS:2 [Diversispora eburnea]|uniref:3073_t:CDS:1 n=1 Tax=Diversispora eburnea TaxID=1213867 RepID=A0A9N9F347_9GLOM|nr:3073_t:CDS:2 [Diversispora eburnea]
METKLSCAIKASKELVTNLHRDGLDRGCIATFNNSMVIRQSFTENESSLHRSLEALRNIASGGTCLYDSMYDLITGTFRRKGDVTRPWVMIVVTDGNDISSTRSLYKCAEEIYSKFTRESSNYLFLVGVGDDVKSDNMEIMAKKGNFTYVPVKDFYLLEFVFMTLALKVTNSLSLSVNSLAVNNVSATWAEVQQHRRLSNVAIDYALLIDISYSMNDRIRGPPPPKCFAGHDLKEAYSRDWYCDICGKEGQSPTSKHHCTSCNFDACPSHCESGVKCKPLGYCPKSHPLRCVKYTGKWVCDEDRKLYRGGMSLKCNQCDYDMCMGCLEDKYVILGLAKLILGS